MVAAVAASLVGTGAVLGAYAILSREITANYLGTRPASATLEIDGDATPDLVQRARSAPGVSEAEAREVVIARARVGDDWRRMLLFVIDDFEHMRLNTFRTEAGAWPPPAGSMLIERSAVPMLAADIGQSVLIKTPHGAAVLVPISGRVHDPGLAPAWQERSGYGYITRATLARLGESPFLGELRIELQGRNAREIEDGATRVANHLAASGAVVREIRVPPPAQHPHQRQMTTILMMMMGFSVAALLLSAVVVAGSLSAMLARQLREIGVMKTLGARASQIAGMYAVMVGLLGASAAVASLPLAILGALAFSRAVSRMLNFTLYSSSIPAWVFAVQAVAAVVVPLLVAAVPIAKASRVSVRQAIDDHGVSADRVRNALSRLPAVLRNAARRPARLALTIGLLATGGAMFMTAINVKAGWEAIVSKVYQTRFHDLEVRLYAPQPVAAIEGLRGVEDVRIAEPWGYASAAWARPGQLPVTRTWPDRGHGSFSVMAPPVHTELMTLPVKAGRWLRDDDADAVVLNHVAAAQMPEATVGSTVNILIDGQPSTWRVEGIVEEIGSPAVAYVTSSAFARATSGQGRVRMSRIALKPGVQRSNALRRIDEAMSEAGMAVESVTPLSEQRTAVGEHILILIRTLVAMATILGIVGTLGLGSAMGTSILARTRELAVMKVVGATPQRITRMLVAEGLAVGALSWIAAYACSIPLTRLVDELVGSLGFLAPLPLVSSPWAAGLWLVMLIAVSGLATVLPARRAGALSVREALAQT
jgi:putative ABC transport system permease protein